MKANFFSLAVAVFLSSFIFLRPVSAGLAESDAAYAAQDVSTATKEHAASAKETNLDETGVRLKLGEMYYFGKGVPKDYKVARDFFQKPADNGNRVAQTMLGMFYLYGNGVAQDSQVAVKWFRLAASQGDVLSQYFLGFAYVSGRGVSQDYKAAMKWFQLAANQGNAESQYSIGKIYFQGLGVSVDHVNAVKWLRLAGDQGLHDAQCLLGVMYALGTGVPENPVIGYALFNLAATANDPETANEAVELRDEISQRLSPSRLEAGQQLSRELVKPGNFLKALDRAAR